MKSLTVSKKNTAPGIFSKAQMLFYRGGSSSKYGSKGDGITVAGIRGNIDNKFVATYTNVKGRVQILARQIHHVRVSS
ncbi:hypothetical protein KCP71_02820 [Salmonella enterica subsp. enterica]|nr:hypothetical protein KCP71_02820 [Salmonella enterica subsp. enterica]